MAFGVTDEGFIKKDFDTIRAEKEAKAIVQWGPEVDLSIFSPIGAMIYIDALEEADLWDRLELVYYSNHIDNATGVNLDRVVATKGLTRKDATRSIVDLEISGVDTTVVPIGFIAQTSSGIQFITTVSGIISGGTVTLEAQSVETGLDQNVTDSTITEINTPVVGVTAVTNPAESTGGADDETDAELRARYKSTGGAGSSVDALQAAFLLVESITSATVIDNKTDVVDGEGRPAHSYESVIKGGTDAEIGEVFLNYGPAGIETFGSEVINPVDSQGFPREYKFNRPSTIDVYVEIDIVTNANWQAGADATVKRNTVEYIGGTYLTETFAGLGIGIDVFSWRVIAAQSGIAGIETITAKVGTVPSPTGDTVDILIREEALTDETKIVVNVS